MGRFRWTCAARTDVGRVRSENEDSVFCSGESGVFVVADGMGGHAAGEVASAIASELIGTRLCEMETEEGMEQARSRFVRAFEEAGEEIVRQASEDASRLGMGTTATVLVLRPDDHYIVGHIGDSRAYLIRDGAMRQITRDHSWVQEQVDRGTITPEQARNHPQSNIITRALGTEVNPRPDIFVGRMREDDRYVLATDGLTDMVSEERIAEVATAAAVAGLPAAADTLVAEANEAGGLDNITVLLVAVQERQSSDDGR